MDTASQPPQDSLPRADKTINLILNNPILYQPEKEEYPTIEIDGVTKTLFPFIALALIPSEGWKAVLAGEKGVCRKPLACFVIVKKEDGTQQVEGTIIHREGFLDSAEHDEDFLGYEAPGEKDDWTEPWEDWHGRKSKGFDDLTGYRIAPNRN